MIKKGLEKRAIEEINSSLIDGVDMVKSKAYSCGVSLTLILDNFWRGMPFIDLRGIPIHLSERIEKLSRDFLERYGLILNVRVRYKDSNDLYFFGMSYN